MERLCAYERPRMHPLILGVWCRRGVRWSIKDEVYLVALRSVLICGFETWSFRVEVWRLLVFEHCCLCIINRIWWEDFVSYSDLNHRVLGSVVQPLNQNRSRWLGDSLRMATELLPRCTLFSEAGSDWKEDGSRWLFGDSKKLWVLTSGLALMDTVALPGWVPRDPRNRWLETTAVMADCCYQWCFCIRSLSFLCSCSAYCFSDDLPLFPISFSLSSEWFN